MDEAERRKQYEICKERGHQSSGMRLSSIPPWDICKHCGTHYRTETRLIEANVPDDDSQ